LLFHRGGTFLNKNIDWIDYLLVGVGVLLLPVFLIGLLPIGIVIYRLGDKMQKYKQETDEALDRKFGTETTFSKAVLDEWR